MRRRRVTGKLIAQSLTYFRVNRTILLHDLEPATRRDSFRASPWHGKCRANMDQASQLNLFSKAGKEKPWRRSRHAHSCGSTASIRTVYDSIIRKKFHSRHL